MVGSRHPLSLWFCRFEGLVLAWPHPTWWRTHTGAEIPLEFQKSKRPFGSSESRVHSFLLSMYPDKLTLTLPA